MAGAGGSVIGALRVILGADTAEFETGLKNASKKLDQWGKTVSNAAKIAAAAMATAGVGLGLAIKGNLEQADKLGKMAQSIGVPVEELSKLKHAADLSDVSLETLSRSVGRLSRNLVDAASGATQPIEAFKMLGIGIKNADGSLRTVSDILPQIAEKFAAMRDGPEKTAIAMKLLGRAGAEMIPMLNAGKAGLQEMMQEAEQLGLVIDTKTAKAAEEFNDNLTRLRRVFDGIVTQVSANLAPALAMLSGALVKLAKDNDIAKVASNGFMIVIKGAVEAGYTAAIVLRRLGAELVALWKVVSSVGNWENMKAAWAEFVAEGEMTKGAIASIRPTLEAFWKSAEDYGNQLKNSFNNTGKGIIDIANTTKDALDKFLESVGKRRAAMEAETQTIGLSAGAHERLKTILQAEEIAKKKLIDMDPEQRANVLAAADAIGLQADRMETLRDRWQEFSSTVMGVRSSLENAFVDAITQAKSLKDVVKSLIQEFARLAAQTAFRQLFGGQTDWSNAAGSGFNPLAWMIPRRALGGPVTGGMPYMVGERGPELFVPQASGQIVSNRELQGGGGGSNVTIVNHNDFRGADPSMQAWIKTQLALMERKIRSGTPADVERYRYNNPNAFQGAAG